jgi:RNA polymerase sigma-70 factor, ECF subfamily
MPITIWKSARKDKIAVFSASMPSNLRLSSRVRRTMLSIVLRSAVLDERLDASGGTMGGTAGKPDHHGDEAINALLEAVSSGATSGGDPRSEAELLEVVYAELRAIAGSFFKTERQDHTLEPTALVHEAFVKLVRGSGISWQSRAHFVAIAAKAMRQVLIDHARAKRAQKRAGDGVRVTLSGIPLDNVTSPLDAINVSDQLERLAIIDPRQGRIVEMRFFAGMTTREIALVLGVSERTVELDWRMARAWLRRELDKESS